MKSGQNALLKVCEQDFGGRITFDEACTSLGSEAIARKLADELARTHQAVVIYLRSGDVRKPLVVMTFERFRRELEDNLARLRSRSNIPSC